MVTKVCIENFAILDFEASSLSQGSWPIEVGLSWIANGHVRTWSSLIRPDPAWNLGDWSPQSAEVHGIPLSDLQDAPSAAEVAEAFLDVVGRRTLVSDAAEFEARWLSRLLRTTGRAEIPSIEDFDAVSFAVFSGYALDMLYETVERRPAPHRAGPDTARLVRGWLRAVEHQASLQTEGKTA
ncbi:exonuclease domain-containing protein [Mameliella alba]|uniref:3'-5' exonuclease n=1 Tax=Mameliella alba TaxID=561184 RepID=UPI001431968D|nr:exonuclease domain-containing protein [Mameliella alba]